MKRHLVGVAAGRPTRSKLRSAVAFVTSKHFNGSSSSFAGGRVVQRRRESARASSSGATPALFSGFSAASADSQRTVVPSAA
jgi:hypothetical protein